MANKDYSQEDLLFQKYISQENSSALSKKESQMFLDAIETGLDKKKQERSLKTNPKPSSVKDDVLFQEWLLQNPKITHKKKEDQHHSKINKKSSSSIPRLDLHGVTRNEVLKILSAFFNNLPSNVKKVRIIHGKGITTGKKSVIREEVRLWLSEEKNQPQRHCHKYILDFSYEKPENGGHGATLVWLK